jgi:thioredoxin-like negative regulator of GroEL
MMALKAKQKEELENMQKGHGTYTEITEEEFLPHVTKSKYVIVHFFHKDFERCKIMDMHLKRITQSHKEALIVRIDAEKCPFFINKLRIQMLPSVLGFQDGIHVDRIIGFEELGGTDEFPTILLTRKLIDMGMLLPKNDKEAGVMRINKGKKQRNDDYSDDEDY